MTGEEAYKKLSHNIGQAQEAALSLGEKLDEANDLIGSLRDELNSAKKDATYWKKQYEKLADSREPLPFFSAVRGTYSFRGNRVKVVDAYLRACTINTSGGNGLSFGTAELEYQDGVIDTSTFSCTYPMYTPRMKTATIQITSWEMVDQIRSLLMLPPAKVRLEVCDE